MPQKLDDAQEEHYTVTLWRDARTGIVVREDWRNKDRIPHRLDGPCYLERDPNTGIVTKELWRRDGKPYRADAPAAIKRDGKTGRVIWSKWYDVFGQRMHRPSRKKRPGAQPSPS